MNRDRKLIFLTVLYFAILGCFLLGCSEGTDSSPVSALMSDISTYESNSSLNKVIGLVLYSSNNEAASKVLVNLKDNNNGDPIKSELTNIDGSFTFTGISNGSYTLEIKSPNYDIDKQVSNCNVVINNGYTTPNKNYIFLKSNSSNASDTAIVEIFGYIKHLDGSAIKNAKATLYQKIGKTTDYIDEVNVLSNGYYIFSNIEPGQYYILVEDESAETNPTRIDLGIDNSGNVNPPTPFNIDIYVKPNDDNVTINISIKSAYTNAPLELATVKINGENQGTTDKKGELIVNEFPLGVCNFEVSKEGFETLKTTRNFNASGSENIDLTMIEDTKDGYGSITGRYVDIDNQTGKQELYVRLYRLIERTQTSSLTNKTETWYDVDKNYILTTKTSNGTGTSTEGSFKLTHIEPGNYQIYIGTTPDYPDSESRSQVYDDFVWTQLKENATGSLIITQPLKVVSDQTTYWTNYEQGNN